MKILVTGAGGYLGCGIVKQLLDDGIDVIASCLDLNNHIDERAKVIVGDIFEIDNPYIYYEKPDVLLHLAWKNGFSHNDFSHINDLPKHYKFISSLVNSGIQRIAVMGSMHEIGLYEGCIKEDTPTHPMSLYGISKDALRNAVMLLCKNANLSCQWLRGYYIVGRYEAGASIFSKIALAEKNGRNKFPFTSGRNQYDFIDYDDFCLQTAAVVEQSEICGIINICKGTPEKLSDRVERFIAENNFNISLEYNKYPDRPYDSKAVWGDDTKIKQIIDARNKKQRME